MFGWLSGSSAPVVPMYDEIPTPKSDAEFQEIRNAALVQFEAMIKETEGWTPVTYGDGTTGISVWSKATPGTSINAAKSVGIVAAPIEEVYKVCHVESEQQAAIQDPEMISWKEIKTVGDVDVIQSGHKTPYPLSERENLFLRFVVVEDNGSKKLVQQSINVADVPTLNGRVRSVIVIGGYLLEPIEDGKKTRITRLLQLDPKGNVPTFVVNMYIAKVGDTIARVRTLLKVGQ